MKTTARPLWKKEKTQSGSGPGRLAGSGVIDFQVQLAQSPALVDEAVPTEECCRRTEEDWAAFLQKMPPVPEQYREYGEKAWFALWAAYVKAQPPYHDDTILMSKKFMSAVWSWDHCFNALAVGRNDPVLGMNQLLCPFYLQQEDGSLSGSFRTGQRAVGLLQAPGARLVHDEADGLARIR